VKGDGEARIGMRYLARRGWGSNERVENERIGRDETTKGNSRMGYIENKCSGSGRRREGGLGKGLAAVLYTIRSQTDCWKRDDGGGCNKMFIALPTPRQS
jgi:hypothetical protein